MPDLRVVILGAERLRLEDGEEGDVDFSRAVLRLEEEEGEEKEETGSWIIFSLQTNSPCFSLHLKYLVFLTVPLCLTNLYVQP